MRGKNAGITDAVGEMFAIAGDKPVSMSGHGTLKQAVVVIIGSKCETVLGNDPFRNRLEHLKNRLDTLTLARKLGPAEDFPVFRKHFTGKTKSEKTE